MNILVAWNLMKWSFIQNDRGLQQGEQNIWKKIP